MMKQTSFSPDMSSAWGIEKVAPTQLKVSLLIFQRRQALMDAKISYKMFVYTLDAETVLRWGTI